jgi:hypothetical protein
MWIEPATPPTPATSATHPILSHPIPSQPIPSHHRIPIIIPIIKSMTRFIHPSVLWNIFMTECILFMSVTFFETCEYVNMWTCEYVNVRYRNMIGWKDEKMQIRKGENKKKQQHSSVDWIEPETPPSPATHPILSYPIQTHFIISYSLPSLHTHTYPDQKINGSIHTPFCSMKHLHDGMYTVHERWIFEHMWIWDIEIW